MEIQDAIIKANKDECSFKRECQTEIEYIIDGHDIYPVIIHSNTRLYTPVILHLYDILADDWIVCGQPPQREIVPSPLRQLETLVRQLPPEKELRKMAEEWAIHWLGTEEWNAMTETMQDDFATSFEFGYRKCLERQSA
jgi:hypothetical protein